MEIREALRIAAEQAGWSPTKIAAEVGVAEKTAKKWLAGDNKPAVDQFQELRRVLPAFADLVDGKAAA